MIGASSFSPFKSTHGKALRAVGSIARQLWQIHVEEKRLGERTKDEDYRLTEAHSRALSFQQQRATADLRAAFPGVWIRDDGAFRTAGDEVSWCPGDLEAEGQAHGVVVGDTDGRVRIGHDDIHDRKLRLKLSQLVALTDYVRAYTL